MRSDLLLSEATHGPGIAGTGSTLGAGPRSAAWRTAASEIDLSRPRIMGILNVTPDSFWDGGRHDQPSDALRQAERLVQEGADLLDVGGESTRPGADPVAPEVERERVVPVIETLARTFPDTLVSVDTVKAAVAEAALDAGAAVVNDVSGLRLDPMMARLCAARGAGLVLMHSRGTVDRMASYETATYGPDPVGEIVEELAGALGRATAAGVPEAAVVLDPGLGFSKRTAESVGVLRQLDRLLELGRPVLLGPSRKRFIGDLAGGLPADERLSGTLAACVAGYLAGARIFRVHDVAATRHALAVAEAVA